MSHLTQKLKIFFGLLMLVVKWESLLRHLTRKTGNSLQKSLALILTNEWIFVQKLHKGCFKAPLPRRSAKMNCLEDRLTPERATISTNYDEWMNFFQNCISDFHTKAKLLHEITIKTMMKILGDLFSEIPCLDIDANPVHKWSYEVVQTENGLYRCNQIFLKFLCIGTYLILSNDNKYV